ncbi:MAG: Hpt domain-containing protein [Bryobacterales bacterium]|nr:Hpt domain-containing protein [Bryobacteraceae bacterium]MDW8131285.1 Hpt domain-containing protein [Bryobacterales bacterium]
MERTPSERILDEGALLDRIGGDAEFLRELASMFGEQREQLLGEIRRALERSDLDGLARAAHTLKGCVGNLGAGVAFEAARRLEMLARERRLEHARSFAEEVEAEVARFEAALLRLAEELNRA